MQRHRRQIPTPSSPGTRRAQKQGTHSAKPPCLYSMAYTPPSASTGTPPPPLTTAQQLSSSTSPASLATTKLDPLSYVAPTRVRAFLCPVGLVSRTRFAEFVAQLEATAVIRLGDVTPDQRPERVLFSPQGFPSGILVYNFTTSVDYHHTILEDLELYRRTLAVFGLADYNNISSADDLIGVIAQLQATTPQAVIHKVILFDCPLQPDELPSSDFICVPPRHGSARTVTSMRTIVCDLTSALLAELPLLAKAFEAADFIASPLARDDDYDSVMLHANTAQAYTSPYGSASSLPSVASRDKPLSYPLSHHSERQRQRRRGRALKMIANIYLLAGRTTDALRDYVEAVVILKNINDHLWHAACIEGIGVCMVVLAYIGVQFTIPSVVLPPAPSTNTLEKNQSKPEPLHLIDLLPQMTSTILNLYNRSQNFPGESIPQITYAETILRIINLQTCICLAGGWDQTSRAAAVLSRPIAVDGALRYPQVQASKMKILAWITTAQAVRLDGVDVVDATRILSGIAAASGKLGFQRKRALVLRQLVLELIPRIVQARVLAQQNRKIKIADGVTDDAASDYSNNQTSVAAAAAAAGGTQGVDSGIIALLDDICATYGVPLSSTASPIVSTFGWPQLRLSILRSCIELCRVLPDYRGVVKYTNMLLQSTPSDVITAEEQVSLMRNMYSACASATSLGMHDFEDVYWDPYLVRDVAVVESSMWAVPMPVKSLQQKDVGDNVFIYNPFDRSAKNEGQRHLFVLDEPVEVRVLLQNPFAFELDIRSISLVGLGASFSCDIVSAIVPPRKVYPISIYLTPTATGSLTINSCVFQVYGCKETTLPITPQQITLIPLAQTKKFGLDARATSVMPLPAFGTTKEINIDVVPALPLLRVNRVSLAQSSVMLLEGERRRFSVTLGNMSDKISVNFMQIRFSDSTMTSLRAALSYSGSSGGGYKTEMNRYEIEYFLLKRNALTCVTDLSQVEFSANGEMELEIEVLGKRGLATGAAEISYSHIPSALGELAEKQTLYERKLAFEVNVTVNPSIEVASCDLVPFSFDMPIVRRGPAGTETTTELLTDFLAGLGLSFEKVSGYCLMLLDLRNSWSAPLCVELQSTAVAKVVKDIIQPGHVSRLLVPIRRLDGIDPTRPIPSLMPAKQFVVATDPKTGKSQGKRSGGPGGGGMWTQEVERAVFWYREKLLESLTGRWTEEFSHDPSLAPTITTTSGRRMGMIELRALRITPQMVDILVVEPVNVEMSLVESRCTKKSGRFHWLVEANEFVTLVTKITRAESWVSVPDGQEAEAVKSTVTPTSGVLRVQPALRNQTGKAALDINLRIMMNGVQQQPVTGLQAGETRVVETDLIVLARGEYEFVASFEEVGGVDAGTRGRRYVGRDKVVLSVY
ncbi:TRAPP II complex [Limtongia smithiae]|uniref:TRAPP II complex n=1 Tax=Limtongia smithiae TaxID=1125753 RepID=UPI0034CFFD3F